MLRHLLRAILLVALFAASPAAPQGDAVDLAAWERVAERAEATLEVGRASDAALETLRAEVSRYRDALLAQQSKVDPSLKRLQEQLNALGPAPEDGSAEPAEIATRRAELKAEIARLEAPIKQAEEAFTRADGIVKQIDALIRARQADALLERGEMPVKPSLWQEAVQALSASGDRVVSEVSANWRNDVRRKILIDGLPGIVFMVALAILLVFHGPSLAGRLANWMRDRTRRGTGVWTTLVELGRIALQVLGLTVLVKAAESAGMLGTFGRSVVSSLPWLVLVLLSVRWLADRLFSDTEADGGFDVPANARAEARWDARLLAVGFSVHLFGEILAEADQYSETVMAVLDFPVLVVCAILLYRLGAILRRVGQIRSTQAATQPAGVPTQEGVSFTARVSRLIGTICMAVAVVGPLMAAAGYTQVGLALVYPAAKSLALFAALLALQGLVRDLYKLVTGTSPADTNSLVPIISGVVLTLTAMPLLALIWGARVTDLTELWARFREGFTLGDTRISPTDFLTFAVVFGVGYVLTRLLQSGLRGSVLPRTSIDQGGRNAIVSGTGYVGIFLSAVVAISTAGIDLSSLALVAGALSVGIGFGLQNIVQNFVSGIILLIERPISEGDWIEVGGQMGTVRNISVRSTRIETFDRTDVIVPNADLVSNTVTNYTRGNVLGRLIVQVGVAYGTDTRKVEDLLYKIARDHPMVLMNPAPSVVFQGFGASSLDFDVRMILRDVNQIMQVKTEINHEIARVFTEEGIEIPFAQQDIWFRNPETLGVPRSSEKQSRNGSTDEETRE